LGTLKFITEQEIRSLPISRSVTAPNSNLCAHRLQRKQ